MQPELYLAAESDLGSVVGHLDALAPKLLLIDSVQTMAVPDAEGAPGGVTQVRAVTTAITAVAKERGIAVVLVGHRQLNADQLVPAPAVLLQALPFDPKLPPRLGTRRDSQHHLLAVLDLARSESHGLSPHRKRHTPPCGAP